MLNILNMISNAEKDKLIKTEEQNKKLEIIKQELEQLKTKYCTIKPVKIKSKLWKIFPIFSVKYKEFPLEITYTPITTTIYPYDYIKIKILFLKDAFGEKYISTYLSNMTSVEFVLKYISEKIVEFSHDYPNLFKELIIK